MTQALSTTVHTGFANKLYASRLRALDEAQYMADEWGGPVGIWERGGWFAPCDVAPELIEPQPELSGWELIAVVDPGTEEGGR